MDNVRRYNLYALLAVLLALRSVVPTGYMLEPTSMVTPLGFYFTLCPTQNRQLNFSALNNDRYSHIHRTRDPHPVPPDTQSAENDQKLELSNFPLDCGLWLSSPGSGVNKALVPLSFQPAPIRYPIEVINQALGRQLPGLSIRGPPHLNRLA